MTTGIDGDPGRAMAESMTTLSVTMACLDDEEWDAAASKTGLRPDERACAQGVQRQFFILVAAWENPCTQVVLGKDWHTGKGR